MEDNSIEIEIRKALREWFPDSVCQVTLVDNNLHIDFVGGRLGSYNCDFPESVQNELMECVWSVCPNMQLWFEMW